MKRYYVEEENGKEIKRKLTTFANDDLTQLSDDELKHYIMNHQLNF